MFISCSSDDNKLDDNQIEKDSYSFLLKDNISKIDLDIESKIISYNTSKAKTKSNSDSVILESNFKDSFGEERKSIVEYNGSDLFTISYDGSDLVYFVQQLNNNEFIVLNEKEEKLQKISMIYDSDFNLNINTIEIYNDNTIPLNYRRGWYDCMEDRMSDPLNQVLLVGASAASAATSGISFLGYMSGVAGLGIYCLL